MTTPSSVALDYAKILSLDPKWHTVRPGQYAVARMESDTQIAIVLAVEDTRVQAVAFARGLRLQGIAVLYRDGEQRVEMIPWHRELPKPERPRRPRRW